MQSSWYRTISWLLLGAGEKHTVIRVFNPLDELIAKNMAGTQERIRESLQQFIYTIDEQTSIGLITGPGRFEQVLGAIYPPLLVFNKDYRPCFHSYTSFSGISMPLSSTLEITCIPTHRQKQRLYTIWNFLMDT